MFVKIIVPFPVITMHSKVCTAYMGPERAKTLDTCDLDPTATIATDSKSKKKKNTSF